jgi:hypothetical protein
VDVVASLNPLAKFTCVVQLDDDSPCCRTIDASSAQAAIKAALQELQSLVKTTPNLTSAVTVVGEGDSEADATWIGAWVWNDPDGFVWSQPG